MTDEEYLRFTDAQPKFNDMIIIGNGTGSTTRSPVCIWLEGYEKEIIIKHLADDYHVKIMNFRKGYCAKYCAL